MSNDKIKLWNRSFCIEIVSIEFLIEMSFPHDFEVENLIHVKSMQEISNSEPSQHNFSKNFQLR